MDIREFKKWIIENHFEENDLFQEALICYNNRAYKAAYMFSYLAFTNYMRYLIIDYEGIPLQFEKQWNEKLSKDNKTDCEKNQLITKKWHGIISELQDEDSWDGSLKNIINKEAYNIFCFDTKIRNEFTVKKDLRNVCAHNKDRNITNATVEDLWDFIVYIKPLSVINGTSEYIISKMKDILNLCNKSEYKEKAKEIYSFYESCYGNEKKQLFDNICKLVNLYYPCESTSFWIYLFELIFEKKSVEEYNWIPENPQLELFIKINVENYDSTIDKVHFYKALEKEDSEWSSFSSYSMTKIFNLGHNNLLKKKLLIEIYNYENHYNFWNNMLLSSDDWNLYLQYPEIKSAIICKENISILLKEIAKLYSYKNYYGNICTTDTFDYLNFNRDKISKKVLLILYLLKENYINNYSEEINDLIERCKRLIKYEKSYPTDDNYKYMCNVLRRDEEIFNWLSRLIS